MPEKKQTWQFDILDCDFCPITGLKVFKKNEWIDILCEENYTVSFALIGGRIIYVRPKGSYQKIGMAKLLEEREKFVKTVNLFSQPYVEIKDYSQVVGIPPRVGRNQFSQFLLDEHEKGHMLGYWGYNASWIIRTIFNVGVSLHKPQIPLKVVDTYQQAIMNAFEILHKHNLSMDYHQTEQERWNLVIEGTSVNLKIVGNKILYLKARGEIKETYLSKIFDFQMEVMKEANLFQQPYYYRIYDFSQFDKFEGSIKSKIANRLKELQRQLECRHVFCYGLPKSTKLIAQFIAKLLPMPVKFVEDLPQAIKFIQHEEANQKTHKKKSKEIIKGLKKVSRKKLNLYSEELLHIVASINWQQAGMEVERVSPENPLRSLLDALVLLKEDFDLILREKEERDYFLQLINSIPVALIVLGSQGLINTVNRSAQTLLGYSEEDFARLSLENLLQEEKLIKTIREHKNISSIETDLTLKNGNSVSVIFSSSIITDEAGEVKWIILTAVDNTLRKKAKEKIAEIAKDWQTTFDATKEMISIQSSDYSIINVNKCFAQSLNLPAKELIGKKCYEVMHRTQGPPPFCILKQGLNKPEGETTEYYDDQMGHLEISVYPIIEDDNSVKRVIHIIRDINERKRAEVEREEIQKKIFQSAKLASLGVLAAGVGHEINNPLAIIKGNVSLMEKNSKYMLQDESSLKQIIEAQKNAIDRIVKVVNGLRSYVNLDNDIVETINVNLTIEKVLSLIKTIYEKEGYIIETRLCQQELTIQGSTDQFQHIITTLLSNAKDSFKEREEGTIIIETIEEDESAIIKVSDNGKGIDPKIMPNIFDTFFTTKEVGKGMGLGLTIARNIIEKMEGHIEVESSLGQGSCFKIMLPLLNTQDDQIKASERVEKPLGNVLVVDDEEAIRLVLSNQLNELGYNVESACNGKEALSKILKTKYDLIFVDIKMPIMNGKELIRRIREEMPDYRGKIFIVSGIVDEDIRQIKVDGFLDKPFTERDILNLIQKI